MKHMLHVKAALFSLAGLLFSSGAALAQTHAADGVIRTDEYGPSNSYQYSTSDGKWFMTWDNTNLYVAVSDSRYNSPTVIYLDLNPLNIVNGGTNADGTTAGFNNYDGTNGTLPFRGDAVIYFKGGYNEYRLSNGVNDWGPQTANSLATDFGGGNVREIIIPWTSLGISGKPAAFNWLGYAINDKSLRIDGLYEVTTPSPSENYTGVQKGNIPFVRYFTVPNINVVGSAFARNSYTQVGPPATDFGALSVYDFTLNDPSTTVNRANGGGDWNIAGNLKVQAGTLYLGTSVNKVTVNGNLIVSNGGILQAGNAQLTVAGNFDIKGSFDTNNTQSTLTLVPGGDSINVPNNSFSLNSLSLINGTRRILNNNLEIKSLLSILNNSVLVTGRSTDTNRNNNVTLTGGTNGAPARLDERLGGYLLGSVSASNNANATNTTYNFGGIGLTLTSNTLNTPGLVSVRRITGQTYNSVDGKKSVSRQYEVNSGNNTNLSVELQFNYYDNTNGFPSELNSATESMLSFFKASKLDGPYEKIVTPASAANPGGNVVVVNGLTTLTGFYTLSDGNQPLPVELASFTGQYANNSVLLNWTTASEKNNKGFGVERRVGEGSNWQPVAFVAGKSANGAAYKYVDVAAPQGTVYYRLRQEDNDGTTAYSPVVAVVVAGQVGGATLALSPVPTADVLTISGFGDGKHTAEVYDLRGRRVLTQEISDAQSTLQVSALPSGVYLVRVQGAGSAQKGKFVKL